MIGQSVFLMLLSVPMFAFGRWGQRRAVDLAGHSRAAGSRERKHASIRRGAKAWQVIAVACLITGLATLVTAH